MFKIYLVLPMLVTAVAFPTSGIVIFPLLLLWALSGWERRQERRAVISEQARLALLRKF